MDRAHSLLRQLEEEIGPYTTSGQTYVETVRESPGSTTWLSYLRVRAHPDRRWSTLVGDFLHNCRSALDSFAYARITAREPGLSSEERRGIYFPITESRNQYYTSFAAHQMGERAWGPAHDPKVIMAFDWPQPWTAVHDLLDRTAIALHVASHPLTKLKRLNNADKHRNLHLAVCAMEFQAAYLHEGATSRYEQLADEPWEPDTLIGRWTIDPGLAGGGPTQFAEAFTVALAEDAHPGRSTSLVARLSAISNAVELAIRQVDMEFARLDALE
jgi:hypothetical protein